MREIQHEGFGKTGVDEVENSDGDGEGQGGIQMYERQQLTQSPNLFVTKACWYMFQVEHIVWSDTMKGSKGLIADRSWRKKRNICFS